LPERVEITSCCCTYLSAGYCRQSNYNTSKLIIYIRQDIVSYSRNLVTAINKIIENKSYSQKAEELGKKISLENGVETAIEFIEKIIY